MCACTCTCTCVNRRERPSGAITTSAPVAGNGGGRVPPKRKDAAAAVAVTVGRGAPVATDAAMASRARLRGAEPPELPPGRRRQPPAWPRPSARLWGARWRRRLPSPRISYIRCTRMRMGRHRRPRSRRRASAMSVRSARHGNATFLDSMWANVSALRVVRLIFRTPGVSTGPAIHRFGGDTSGQDGCGKRLVERTFANTAPLNKASANTPLATAQAAKNTARKPPLQTTRYQSPPCLRTPMNKLAGHGKRSQA